MIMFTQEQQNIQREREEELLRAEAREEGRAEVREFFFQDKIQVARNLMNEFDFSLERVFEVLTFQPEDRKRAEELLRQPAADEPTRAK